MRDPGFGVPQDDLAFICTTNKVADVLGDSNHPVRSATHQPSLCETEGEELDRGHLGAVVVGVGLVTCTDISQGGL